MYLSKRELKTFHQIYKNVSFENIMPVSSNNSLILLPDDSSSLEFANIFMQHKEQSSIVYFISRNELKNFYSDEVQSSMCYYNFKDLNSLQMPSVPFLEKVFSLRFKNIIDLNSEFNRFVHPIIFFAPLWTVKLGFHSDISSNYYNVVLDSKNKTNYFETFELIKKFILI
jgi:hypothetical protein